MLNVGSEDSKDGTRFKQGSFFYQNLSLLA